MSFTTLKFLNSRLFKTAVYFYRMSINLGFVNVLNNLFKAYVFHNLKKEIQFGKKETELRTDLKHWLAKKSVKNSPIYQDTHSHFKNSSFFPEEKKITVLKQKTNITSKVPPAPITCTFFRPRNLYFLMTFRFYTHLPHLPPI